VGNTGACEILFEGPANLTLLGTTVQNDPAGDGGGRLGSCGVALQGGGQYAMSNCDITGNGGPGLRLGGVGGSMHPFNGNRIHSNGGDQIVAQNGTTWDLDSFTCDGGQNQVYCYAAGHVGVVADGGGLVAAGYWSWENASPTLGTDYYGNVLLTVGGSSGPTSCSPPVPACP
jgi:hypothetical protein